MLLTLLEPGLGTYKLNFWFPIYLLKLGANKDQVTVVLNSVVATSVSSTEGSNLCAGGLVKHQK